MDNALKFTHEGSVEVRVRPEQGEGGQALIRMEVRDTGIGVPKDKFGLIFGYYEQVRSLLPSAEL